MDLSSFKLARSDLERIIFESDQYYAHLSKDGSVKEYLLDHLLLVQEYCYSFLEKNGLERILISLVEKVSDNEKIIELLLESFFKAIIMHDFGKINPEFQRKKMQNKIESFEHDLSSGHSLLSAYLFILFMEKKAQNLDISVELEPQVDYLILCFSYPILKHHSSKLNFVGNDLNYKEKLNDLERFVPKLSSFIENDSFISEINEYVINNQSNIYNKVSEKPGLLQPFPLFALLKLNYSVLTASDYYATTHFMKSWKSMYQDFGVLSIELKQRIIFNIENSTSYNKETYNNILLKQPNFEDLMIANNENLNKLRQKLAAEVIQRIRSNLEKNLFYIEAPTGSGKTNLSMLALAEFIRDDINNQRNNVTKVFYVFPFTTLITQTFKSLKETLGVVDDEIVQIHSRAGFSSKNKNEEDDHYGENRQNFIDYQFVNYPIALLSHVKFFDILKSNKKSSIYLLHRLANSVVIIDELQSYSPKQWDKVIYFINSYAKYFNIKFILMSATLPKIDKLLSHNAQKNRIDVNREEFVYLNKNKQKYFTNPNFSQRVQFDFSLLADTEFKKEDRESFLENLWAKLLDESNAYKNEIGRVHTIIEFIYKKTASEFLELILEKENLFEEIFILSGTTLEPRRREIIAKLKSSQYQNKNILLITTQVVEAGVDIDMDLGFKDSSLVDSDEQLAGRINRNVNKRQCKLFLFDLDDANVIYGKDKRYELMQDDLSTKYHQILECKNFDLVYNAVMEDRNSHNKQSDYADNLPSYLKLMRKLDFPALDKDFKLIENEEVQNVTIFAPVVIPVAIPYSTEKNFSQNELDFLKNKNKFQIGNDCVSGQDVWALFEDAILNKDGDFTNQKIQIITLQGLLSKFTFSLGVYSKSFQNMQKNGNVEEKHGYFYLHNVDEVYDYNDGIKNLDNIDTFIW